MGLYLDGVINQLITGPHPVGDIIRDFLGSIIGDFDH
jgi:hypothetical protein